MTTILWLRHDLRLADHPALHYAIKNKGPVIPVYIHAPEEDTPWQPGGASHVWLHHSLRSLDHDLQKRGGRLIVRSGPSLDVLQQLIDETQATSVVWHRQYEPAAIARDTEVKTALKAKGVEAKSFNGNLLFEPWDIKNKSGNPFLVFTPYYRHCMKREAPRAPLPAPRNIPAPHHRGPGANHSTFSPPFPGTKASGKLGPSEKPAQKRRSSICSAPASTITPTDGTDQGKRAPPASRRTSISEKISPVPDMGSRQRTCRNRRSGRHQQRRKLLPARSGLARIRLPPPLSLPTHHPATAKGGLCPLPLG